MRNVTAFAIGSSIALVSGFARATPEKVTRGDDFVDTIGVNTHFTFGDTVYGQQTSAVAAQLFASGIRHVRDVIAPEDYDLVDHGIHLTALVDLGYGTTMSAIVAKVKAFQLGHTPHPLDAIEGPNEPDNFWSKLYPQGYLGQGFPAGAIQFQKDLYAGIKADSDLQSLPVMGIALGSTLNPGNPNNPLGNAGELASYVDWGNFHPYPSGNAFDNPVAYDTIARYYWDSTFPSLPIDGYGTSVKPWMPYYQLPYGQKPMGATETGYSNWVGGDSELVVGKYLPRLFLEFYLKGIVRAFSYEFVDEGTDDTNREQRFGMLHADLTPKPAFLVLSSLIHLVGGDGSAFDPGTLDLDVTVSPVTVSASAVRPGADAGTVTYDRLDYVKHVVLGAKDGRRFVILWTDISCADHSVSPALELTPPPMPVSLVVHDSFASAIVHSFDDAGKMTDVAMSNPSTLALLVPDRPLVVELLPSVVSVPDGGASADASDGSVDDAGTSPSPSSGCACDLGAAASPNAALTTMIALALAWRRRRSQRKLSPPCLRALCRVPLSPSARRRRTILQRMQRRLRRR